MNQDPETEQKAPLAPPQFESPAQLFALEIEGEIPFILDSKDEYDVAMKLAEYQANEIPGSLEKAMFHARCSILGEIPHPKSLSEVRFCLCCGQVQGNLLPIRTDLSSLDQQGLMFPYYQIYMRYMLWCTFLFSVVALGVQVPILLANCSGKTDPDTKIEYDCGFYMSTFLNPRARDITTNYFNYSGYLIIVLVLGYIGGYALFLVSKFRLKLKLKQRYVGVEEFSVAIEDLTEEQAHNVEYLQSVTNRGLLAPMPKIACINPVRRDVSKFPLEIKIRQLVAKQKSIDHQIQLLMVQTDRLQQKDAKEQLRYLKYLKIQIDSYIKSLSTKASKCVESSTVENPKEHVELTVVTFESREDAFRVHRVASIVKWASFLFCSCCWKRKVHKIRSVEPPQDMNWRDIGKSKIKIVGSMVLSNFSLVVFVAIMNSYGRLIGQDVYEYAKTYKGDDKGTWSNFQGDQFLKVISLVTIIFNNIISQVIKLIKNWEIEESGSSSFNTKRSRINFMLTLHTISAPMFISYINKKESSEQDSEITNFFLSQLVFNFLLINAFLGPIIMAFSPWDVIRMIIMKPWVKRKLTSKQAELCALQYTQQELNDLFTPPTPDFATRYSYPLVVLFTSLFYFELVPMGMPLTLLYLWIQMRMDRYLFFRFYSKPEQIDREYLLLAAGAFRRGLLLLPLGHLYAKLGLYRPDMSFSLSDAQGLDYLLVMLGASAQAMEGIEVWIVQQIEKLLTKHKKPAKVGPTSQLEPGATVASNQEEPLLPDSNQPAGSEATSGRHATYSSLQDTFDEDYAHFNSYTNKQAYQADREKFAKQIAEGGKYVLNLPAFHDKLVAEEFPTTVWSKFSAQMLANQFRVKWARLKGDAFGPNHKTLTALTQGKELSQQLNP